MAIFSAIHDLDSGVFGAVPVQDAHDFRVRGGIVGDAQLPVRVQLIPDRLDGLVQIFRGRVVHRHDHGKKRRRLKFVDVVTNDFAVLVIKKKKAVQPFGIGTLVGECIVVGMRPSPLFQADLEKVPEGRHRTLRRIRILLQVPLAVEIGIWVNSHFFSLLDVVQQRIHAIHSKTFR